jgi:hypothetical protein
MCCCGKGNYGSYNAKSSVTLYISLRGNSEEVYTELYTGEAGRGEE